MLSFADQPDGWQTVSFPVFEAAGVASRKGIVPFKTVTTAAGERQVVTVLDLMTAQLGILPATGAVAPWG
jgi:hypothetical protein